MNAPHFHKLPPAQDRPALPVERDSRIARARELACEIEALLRPREGEDGYAVRLAQAMTRNLIDQLTEIERPPRSSRAIV
jgi:hypothetical protein